MKYSIRRVMGNKDLGLGDGPGYPQYPVTSFAEANVSEDEFDDLNKAKLPEGDIKAEEEKKEVFENPVVKDTHVIIGEVKAGRPTGREGWQTTRDKAKSNNSYQRKLRESFNDENPESQSMGTVQGHSRNSSYYNSPLNYETLKKETSYIRKEETSSTSEKAATLPKGFTTQPQGAEESSSAKGKVKEKEPLTKRISREIGSLLFKEPDRTKSSQFFSTASSSSATQKSLSSSEEKSSPELGLWNRIKLAGFKKYTDALNAEIKAEKKEGGSREAIKGKIDPRKNASNFVPSYQDVMTKGGLESVDKVCEKSDVLECQFYNDISKLLNEELFFPSEREYSGNNKALGKKFLEMDEKYHLNLDDQPTDSRSASFHNGLMYVQGDRANVRPSYTEFVLVKESWYAGEASDAQFKTALEKLYKEVFEEEDSPIWKEVYTTVDSSLNEKSQEVKPRESVKETEKSKEPVKSSFDQKWFKQKWGEMRENINKTTGGNRTPSMLYILNQPNGLEIAKMLWQLNTPGLPVEKEGEYQFLVEIHGLMEQLKSNQVGKQRMVAAVEELIRKYGSAFDDENKIIGVNFADVGEAKRQLTKKLDEYSSSESATQKQNQDLQKALEKYLLDVFSPQTMGEVGKKASELK